MSRINQFSTQDPVRRAVGPETRALLGELASLIDALWDVEVVRNVEAFAYTGKVQRTAITPNAAGTGLEAADAVELYKNVQRVPVVVYVTLEGVEAGTDAWLTGSTEDTDGTVQSRAGWRDFGAAPKLRALLLPGQTLFVNASSPSGASAAFQLIWVAVPLRGRGPIFPDEGGS